MCPYLGQPRGGEGGEGGAYRTSCLVPAGKENPGVCSDFLTLSSEIMILLRFVLVFKDKCEFR